MNKRFKKIFALIMCLIIMATACAISVSAVVINSVECVCQYSNIAVWKAKSNFTQSYIKLRVDYLQMNINEKNRNFGVKTVKSTKTTKYDIKSFTLTCYPDQDNVFLLRDYVVADFANGAPGYPESINNEMT